MRVHIITNLFAPDELAGAALFSDLACFLNKRDHDVRVTATFSYYPQWKLRPEDKPLKMRDDIFQGIPVRRVRMYVPSAPTGKARLISDLSFLISLIRWGSHSPWIPDVVVTAIPMLSQCLAQRFLYWGKKIPRLVMVQDFVVEAALELGILRMPGLAGGLRWLQRWALRSAQTLTTISPLMLDKLKVVVGEDRRLLFLPNWIHRSLAAEVSRQQGKVASRRTRVLFYAGNLGVKQGLPDFLRQFAGTRAAGLGWQLELHGGGAERDKLAALVAETSGCQLGPVLEEPEYIRSLLTATVCLITQRPGVGANFLPSKLLPALATGTPVLAICDRSSPLANEVEQGRFGVVVSPGDTGALIDVLRQWQQQPELLKRMADFAGERSDRYRQEKILPRLEDELQLLAGG